MSSAIVRLESFAPPRSSGRQPELTDSVLQEAYMRGLKEGAETENASALNIALEEFRLLATHLRQAGTERNNEIDALLAKALAPMLDAVMEHVAPLGMSQRLSQFISSELLRIGKASSAPEAIVKCPPDLLGELTQLVANTEVSNVRIEAGPHDTSAVEIIVEESLLSFDPDQFIADLHDLIKDIS